MKHPSDPIHEKIEYFLRDILTEPDSFEAKLVKEMVASCLNLYFDNHKVLQLKLINRCLKEMRYAYSVFNQYPSRKRLSIFGSARTPEDHPDYIAARDFSAEMAKRGWMCITGAAGGIMKAGHEGSVREKIFGLSIRLSFETEPNVHIEGDHKHISFKYFFIRKLMFLSHSDALTAFPGGYGTMDELFEVLTLIQTGKASVVPVVLLEGMGGSYWQGWLHYIQRDFLSRGTISKEDMSLFHVASTVDDAVQHIENFYSRYHSSRYVGDLFVIRLTSLLTSEHIEDLNKKFVILIEEGQIEQREALPEEDEHRELPRLVFKFVRNHYGILRQLIDAINQV